MFNLRASDPLFFWGISNDGMANRVRFQTLTLSGFGRYDRPTSFQLDGRSCSFTSPNELGKSTFHAGLVATLFGPPAIRTKASAFQSRYRSWGSAAAFWGELDFTVNGEPWRVRQDFDALDVKVWRLHKEGMPELRYQSKIKSARSVAEPDPFGQMVEDWLGIADRSLYEAMFTITQESTVSTHWQIDPRIATLVYGPAVDRIKNSLQEMFDRFREITRATREHGISVGSQGIRDGRSDGRLDVIGPRIVDLESSIETARCRLQTVRENRSRLNDLETKCEQIRSQLLATSQSLELWQAWVDLESKLRPAVSTYERLRQLNERCQLVTRPLAELRGRTTGDLAIFDQAPNDLTERLEYYPLLVQSADEARQNHLELSARAAHLQQEIGQIEATLDGEFAQIRGRLELPDQVEELRLVREELTCVRTRLNELTEGREARTEDRKATEQQMESLASWRTLGSEADQRLSEIRASLSLFSRDHADYLATCTVVEGEQRWCEQQAADIQRRESERQELDRRRARERSTIVEGRQSALAQIETAHRVRASIDGERGILGQRYADFAGAPDHLPELWDRLHEIDRQHMETVGIIQLTADAVTQMEGRVYWRRGLAGAGVAVILLTILLTHGWYSWFVAMIAVGLCVSLRWIYPSNVAEIADAQRAGQQAEAEQLRLSQLRNELVDQIGPQLVGPPEREAEWRRLWPTYRRELDRLDAETQKLPTAEQMESLKKTIADADAQLTSHDAETQELVGEAERAVTLAQAELERRQCELERLRDQLASHADRYFGSMADWPIRPVQMLGPGWDSVLKLAAAASLNAALIGEFVDWCRSLDESTWLRYGENCRELRRIGELLAPDPSVAAARTAAVREATELLQSLEQQEFRLTDAIAPFDAGTDVSWLRDRLAACHSLETSWMSRQQELEELPNIESSAEQLQQATAQSEDAIAVLAPYFDRFGHDSNVVLAAWHERSSLIAQIRDLDREAAEILADSGFASLEELAHESGKAEGLVSTIRAESQELLARTDELWQAVDAPSELGLDRVRELVARRAEQQAELDAAERERAELAATIRQMESDPSGDVTALQAELDALRTEQAGLEKQRDELAAEFQEANRLMQELQRVERTALEGRITAFFTDFSRTPGRRIELDDELCISVRNEDGKRYAPDQLSHGARDQLYLAVYLATTAGFDMPFILDDPFVNCDTERLAAIRACWDRLVTDRQLVLLSHDPQLAAWAPALELREAA